jgi:hypothetical protein
MRRLAAALLLLAAPCAARAQSSASGAMPVAATVDATALTVVGVNNVRFGFLIPGTPTTINPRTSASAGYFLIQGARNAQITITLTLPTQLRVGAAGPTMPITFGANAGCHRNQPNQAICTLYDPATVLTVRIRNQAPPNNHYHVWLGGTVSPAVGQPAGVYTGTVTATVAYTGN